MDEVIYFSRKNDVYPIFSNFSECNLTYDGLTYKSVEAAFQAQKTLDKNVRAMFTTMNPSVAKKQGRNVCLRKDWETSKYKIMVELLKARAQSDTEFKETLLSTGNAIIIEDTTGWHDNTWGKCSCYKCSNKRALNLLGLALMDVRWDLQNNK